MTHAYRTVDIVFGKLMKDGVRGVCDARHSTMQSVESDIAAHLTAIGPKSVTFHVIERTWYRGHVPNNNDWLEFVAHYCVDHGNMGREWLYSFLSHARHPKAKIIADRAFPGPTANGRRSHNLPPLFGAFCGRMQEIERITFGLSKSWPMISIVGPAGIGKTTLAIEMGYRCLAGDPVGQGKAFDFVVWVSAQAKLEQRLWLNEVLDTIAQVMDWPGILQLDDMQQKRHEVGHLLSQHRVLVILDNFETFDDADLDQWIDYFPSPSRLLITSKIPVPRAWSVSVKAMEMPDALALIRDRANGLELHDLVAATDEDLQPLVHVTDGNPKAIVMALGLLKKERIAHPYSLQRVVNDLYAANRRAGTIFDALFAWAWKHLSADGQHVLMALALFVDTAPQDALGATAAVDGYFLATAIEQLVELSLINCATVEETATPRYSMHPLVRNFAQIQLANIPEWEQEMRCRWVEWYIKYTQIYGGMDWQEYAQNYQHLEEEWTNLQEICTWCSKHQKYEEIKQLLDEDHLENISDISGHWQDRIQWDTWLIQAAEQRDDEETLLNAIAYIGWTLTLMNKLEDAESLLIEAWDRCQLARPHTQCSLFHDIAYLLIRQNRFEVASNWLDEHEHIVELFDHDQFEYARQSIITLYDRGLVLFGLESYDQAKAQFTRMLEQCEAVGWQRAGIYAQNWLADVAIKQGNLSEAESLLLAGLPVAERNKDERRTALFKRSFALLEQVRGNLDEAKGWARYGLDGFERLGMEQEAEEMRQLLD